MSQDFMTHGGPGEGQVRDERARLLAAWPFAALLLMLLAALAVQLVLATPEDVDGVRGLALSAAALTEGRWWTLFSHIPAQQGFMAHLSSQLLLVALILANLWTRDPAWMGGWRTILVFLAASLAGAAAHILSGSDRLLTGVWPGLLGLAAYYLTSASLGGAGLIVGNASKGGSADDSAPDGDDRRNLAYGGVVLWLTACSQLKHALGEQEAHLPFALPSDVQSLLIIVGGGVALIIGAALWAPWRLARLLGGAVLVGAGVVMTVRLLHTAREAALPWEALVGGLVAGLALGLLDRRTAPHAAA